MHMRHGKTGRWMLAAVVLAITACAADGTRPAPAPATAGTADASAWREDVVAMAGKEGNDGRRLVIVERLREAGLQPTEVSFTSKAGPGQNVLVPVSGAENLPLLLLGAHYDKVAVGRGAIDNASGSAAVLSLAKRFKHKPLAHHRVAAAFWDQEEKGLLGASAYVASKGADKPALYINFDVFGWGDTLWMMTPTPAHPLAAAVDAAARGRGIALSSGPQYPPSDHLAFQKAGWPAVSFSLVGGDEIAPILQAFSGASPARMPKVMEVIHSAQDTIEQANAAEVEAGIDAVEAAIRAWDAQATQ